MPEFGLAKKEDALFLVVPPKAARKEARRRVDTEAEAIEKKRLALEARAVDLEEYIRGLQGHEGSKDKGAVVMLYAFSSLLNGLSLLADMNSYVEDVTFNNEETGKEEEGVARISSAESLSEVASTMENILSYQNAIFQQNGLLLQMIHDIGIAKNAFECVDDNGVKTDDKYAKLFAEAARLAEQLERAESERKAEPTHGIRKEKIEELRKEQAESQPKIKTILGEK